MQAVTKRVAIVLVAIVSTVAWSADEEDKKEALRRERDALRALIERVQREVEERESDDNEWEEGESDENEWVEEENEWVEEDLEEQAERAEEMAGELAERLEEHAEALGEHLEAHLEVAGERLETWAEEHSSRWEEWAEQYGTSWEEWAEEQEALWEEWSEEYSERWEEWAAQLEEGGFDQHELSELLEHNIDMLGRMPLSEVYEQLLEAPEQIEQMPLDSLRDLEAIVRESVEQAVQGMEEGVAESDFEGLSSSLEQLRDAMKIKDSQLDRAAMHRLREATRAMEKMALQNHFERERTEDQTGSDQEREERLLRQLMEVVENRSEDEIVELIETLSNDREAMEEREAEMEELREEIQSLREEIESLTRNR